MKNTFTKPQVKTYPIESGKKWYVWFRVNRGNPIRIYKGLSTGSYDDRLEEASILAEAVHYKLKRGWLPDGSTNLITTKRLSVSLFEALERIEPNVAKNTFDAYKGAVNTMVESLQDLKFDRVLSENFTRAHAKKCLEFIKAKKSWSNQNYNKNLGYLRSVFAEIIEADEAQVNPFRDMKNLKVVKTVANVPPTDLEMQQICNELQTENHGFYIFYLLIYYCGIRPNELVHLKARQVDLREQTVTLYPEHTKTSKERKIPLLGNLPELLSNLDLSNPDHYVFGTHVPNGGRHSKKNWFSPNPYKLKEDTPNREWKRLVKDGLGIQKSLYSAKHKGADDKLEAGMDKQTICDIFGHSDTKMTERYMHSLKDKRLEAAKGFKMKVF